jgi:hypothetical protein
MNQRRFLLLLILSVLVIHMIQEGIVEATDKNKAATARQVEKLDEKMKAILNPAMEDMENNAEAQALMASGALCAIGIIPGPADSSNIRFGLFNVIANSLDHVIIDSFHALKGESLLHQSVFDVTPPPSGTLTIEYPIDELGKGPAVLSLTSFEMIESVAFSTDPDTYDDLDFGATVGDLDGTDIKLVYDAATPGSTRCKGTFVFNASFNASIAFITQDFPNAISSSLFGN